MNKITLKKFRCFPEEQTARLTPLTLLVGENSTGKTSFMAMIRALWDIAYRNRIPDFKEVPYDLGSFEEVAYHKGDKDSRVDTFEAGFDSTIEFDVFKGEEAPNVGRAYNFSVTFAKDGTVPVPVRRHLTFEKLWIEEFLKTQNQDWLLRVGTERGSWEVQPDLSRNILLDTPRLDMAQYTISPLFFSIVAAQNEFVPLNSSKKIARKDLEQLHRLCYTSLENPVVTIRPYASAPVRSKPRRTYDPARLSSDPEGDYVPMYLADLSLRREKEWKVLKNRLESFGQAAGLFDEITVKHLGRTLGSPFQLHVRKLGTGRKGPWRNLVDVGYGVSQALPLITELLRQDTPPLVLLQQPEVHLHPSAQAALGSLFCQVAAQDSQLIIETHSDYILDRVRMKVRDNNVPLNPEDVSILFFERQGLDVHIHSLRLDEEGNILDVPPNYRNFFMEESQRLWGL